MAKKTRKKRGKSQRTAKRKSRAKAKTSSSPPLPDRRAMEGMMREALGLSGPGRANTALDRAQDVMYQAFEADEPERRVRLAQKALAISSDCADAYVLLAEDASNLKDATRYYEEGVRAGERAIGEESFQEYQGHFWGLLETRPYMRARLGLAECLWQVGRRQEAVEHFQDMLRLNPNDNQGVRYILAACLTDLRQDDELELLLAAYEEDASAAWAYSRVLLAFRRSGDTEPSRKLLTEAKKVNKYVPAYLLGEKPLPRHPPDYVRFGDENEAVEYAARFLPGWRGTPGAITWLRKAAKAPRRIRAGRAKKASPPAAPSLDELPLMRGEVWQADIRRMPMWVESAKDGRVRPWAVMVTDASHDWILSCDIIEEQPELDALWARLAETMTNPAMGEPRRPGEVHVRSRDHRIALEPHLEPLGIAAVATEDLGQLDSAFAEMTKAVAGEPPSPALVEAPGVSPKQLGSFFEAAADYFQKAPWRHVPGDTAIRVECDKFQGGPWYAFVMGQSGLTLGLAVYDELEEVTSLLRGEGSDEANAERTSALSLTFDEPFHMASADLDAAEQFGWPVAGPEAYPCTMRVHPGLEIRAPRAWELELLEGCLRAIPDFLARHAASGQRVSVAMATGELEFVLTRLDEIDA